MADSSMTIDPYQVLLSHGVHHRVKLRKLIIESLSCFTLTFFGGERKRYALRVRNDKSN